VAAWKILTLGSLPALVETADLAAALGLVGVALGGHHDAERVLGVPAQIDPIQHPVAARDQRR